MGKRASSGSADSTALSAAALSAAQVNADELQALVGDLVEVTIGASGDVSLGVGDAEGEEEEEEEEESEEEMGESDEEEEDLAAVEETEEEAEDIEAVEPAEETPTTVKTGPLMKRPAAKARLRKKPSAAPAAVAEDAVAEAAAAEAAAADQAEADGFLMAIADAAIRVESGDLAGLDAPDTGIDAEDAKAVLDILAGSQDDPMVQASCFSLHPNDVSNTERCYHVLSLGPHK